MPYQTILFRDPLLSACRFAEFDTSIIGRGLIISLGSFHIARYFLSSLSIGSGGTKFEIFREHVAYLHSIL